MTSPEAAALADLADPLRRALVPYRGWITGIRRDETAARRESQLVEWDVRRKMIKVNPIMDWSQDQVDAYIAVRPVHRMILLPLPKMEFVALCAS